MPHRVQQVVAGLLALTALTAFTLGVINAPDRGRLPGERADGGSGAPSALIQATEATPLSQERIAGPPEPVPLTPEQQANLDEEKAAKAEAAAAARLEAAGVTRAPPPPAAAPAAPAAAQDRVGDLLENAAPPPEEPPH
jgi:hypothetical protein